MRVFCKWLLTPLAFLMPAPAFAAVTVSFYSHELGSDFPHAFFTVKGTLDRGGTVDTNFGFTAKSVSPAILMGPVKGVVESVKPKYVASSDRRFSLTIDDAKYDALMAVVAKWKAIPGRSYDLGKRNCVHFIADAAVALGLKAPLEKALLKKPRSFLINVQKLNPWVK